MKKLFAIPLLLLGSMSAGAESLSVAEAKSKADRMESELNPSETQSLRNAQARVAIKAFPGCVRSTGVPPSDFTVVIKVGNEGKAVETWRKSDSPFAKCFQQSMKDRFQYDAEPVPFFTSFEYSHSN